MSTPDLPLRMQQLKLYGMASQWPELLAKMRLHAMDPEHWMAELLQAESAERQVRAQRNASPVPRTWRVRATRAASTNAARASPQQIAPSSAHCCRHRAAGPPMRLEPHRCVEH